MLLSTKSAIFMFFFREEFTIFVSYLHRAMLVRDTGECVGMATENYCSLHHSYDVNMHATHYKMHDNLAYVNYKHDNREKISES